MKSPIARIFAALLCFCLLVPVLCAVPARAVQDEAPAAVDVSSTELVTHCDGFEDIACLFDGNMFSGITASGDTSELTLAYAEGLGSLYIIFDVIPGPYTITDNASGQSQTFGQDGFLHEFVDLEAAFGAAPESVTLRFDGAPYSIFEIYAYTSGQVPDSVQKWSGPADGRADLLLFSAHCDDEQLFFAGLLPYYTAELGYQVQVAYLCDHRRDTLVRVHEMLNGLWAVGVRNYPVYGSFVDFLTEDMAEAYSFYQYYGHSKADLEGFVVEQIRRFKPMVVVGHDFNGEYGNAQHKVYADLVANSLDITSDASYYPESAEAYGTWDVPKTYFHLYSKNTIRMDWDTPMESFGGMTPFEVSKYLGWPCHDSQVWGMNWWIEPYDTAAAIPVWSPCDFGLYRSTVGEDVEKNDFFENLTTYTEQDRIAEAARLEEERRLEAERLQEERLREEQRKEDERLAAEAEARRLEEERLAREAEEARKQAELEARQAQEAARKECMTGIAAAAAVLAVALVALLLVKARKKVAQ